MTSAKFTFNRDLINKCSGVLLFVVCVELALFLTELRGTAACHGSLHGGMRTRQMHLCHILWTEKQSWESSRKNHPWPDVGNARPHFIKA